MFKQSKLTSTDSRWCARVKIWFKYHVYSVHQRHITGKYTEGIIKGGDGGQSMERGWFSPESPPALWATSSVSALIKLHKRKEKIWPHLFPPGDKKRSAVMLREQREQKTRCPCGHIAVLLNVFVIWLLQGRKALRAHGKNRSAGGERVKGGEKEGCREANLYK